ncbi:hypothetical protein ACIBK9_29095 [Nonomuraea sp. NPDC050227]|uniref:hypothetical protein n=1 Tax=Nonomuraea sp. NPDC050227 TaxID=3364360 RepID=UPI0037B1D193
MDVTGDGKAEVVAGAPAQNGRAGRPVVLGGSSGGVFASGTQVCDADQFGRLRQTPGPVNARPDRGWPVRALSAVQ